MEGGPGHIVAEHVEVRELEEALDFEVHVPRGCSDLGVDLLEGPLDVLGLGALVGAEATDEVCECLCKYMSQCE